MNDYGMIIEPGTLRIQRLLPGPIERVWAYLTESDKRATAGGRRHDVGKRRAAGAGVSQLRSGGRARTTAGQVQTARRLRQQPRPHHLPVPAAPAELYPAEQDQGRPSEVTFELTEQGSAVLLTVTHRRLANRDEMLSVAGGWHTHLDILLDRLHDRAPQPFWSTHARLEEEYRARL